VSGKYESGNLKPAISKTTSDGKSAQALPVVCVCVFLALAVLAVFGQTGRFEFVNYDDPENVYENPVVQKGLSAHAVGWAFTHTQLANWIPLTTLSHILDCQLFGLNAGGHHLVNVFWHAASAVLLFLVLRRMTGGLWRSAFVAAVFAVHPLRAESVAWVSERKDVLSAFFFMLTIGAYVGYVEKQKAETRKQKFYYALAVVFFALGLMAKSMVATLPFVLLLLDYWPLGRMRGMKNSEIRTQNGESKERKADGGEEGGEGVPFWGLVREKIPLFALGAAACAAAALAPGLVVTKHIHGLPLLERIGNALVSYVVYLRQMVFPARLAIPYPLVPNGQPPWKVCLAFAALAAISAAVVACRKKRPWLLTGWLWYVGMLAPVIGIVQISSDAAHADRYTYLPGIGLVVAATWALADWGAGWKYRRGIFGVLMVAVIGALLVFACIQASYWKKGETLWNRALECTTGNSTAHNNLGVCYDHEGKLEDAIAQYKLAVGIKPDYWDAHFNMGVVLVKKSDTDGAIAEYQKAVEINPDYMEAHLGLGNALALKGEVAEAIAQYQQALAIAPDDADARYNLGNALVQHGKVDDAVAQYRKALEIKPDYLQARSNLGNALKLQGDLEGAIAEYRKVLDLNPAYEKARDNLAFTLLSKGDVEGAIVCYQQGIKINPRSADAWANLGLAFFKEGQTREAVDAWQKALKIKPDQLYVLNNLAWLLATTPDSALRDGAKAVALAKEAGQLGGDANPMIQHTLAAAYAETGNYGLAAATAQRGLELAVEQKNDKLAATLQKEIQLYQAGKPARESTPQASPPTAPDAPR
jgi:tetratricopeptide (TPR) repeat protein